MIRVINGAKYNTDTAKPLGVWNNGLSSDNLNYCAEALYRTKAGRYFIHGVGGPNTRYNKIIGDSSWAGGEDIQPLSIGAAKAWAEDHLGGAAYIYIFGEPEDPEKIAKHIYLSPAANRRLEELQTETGRSQGAIIEGLLLG